MNGPDGLDVILVFADPIDAAGWSSGRIETLERLVPHFRQFVRVRHALVSADGLAASLADLLDRTNFGVIYLDQRGMIVTPLNPRRAPGKATVVDEAVLRAACPDDASSELLRTPPVGAPPAAVR